MTRQHCWVVEFWHSLGWTPIEVRLSRSEAVAEARFRKSRRPDFKYRVSKFMRADKSTDAK